MISEGLAPVAYVQSGCDTPSGRDQWVKQFMKFVRVDSYGACLNNKEMPQDIKGSHKMNDRYRCSWGSFIQYCYFKLGSNFKGNV